MIAWIGRILFIIAAFITGLFIEKDALNFPIFQLMIAMLLFTLIVILLAFWPSIRKKFKALMKRNDHHH